MIIIAICYGFLTYWMSHYWQATQFATETFGYNYRDLPILFLSVAPWIILYLIIPIKLPKLSLFSRALLAVASIILTLNIVYHAYYTINVAGAGGRSLEQILSTDHLHIWLGVAAAFAKPIIVFACITYPIFATIRIVKGRRAGPAA